MPLVRTIPNTGHSVASREQGQDYGATPEVKTPSWRLDSPLGAFLCSSQFTLHVHLSNVL